MGLWEPLSPHGASHQGAENSNPKKELDGRRTELPEEHSTKWRTRITIGFALVLVGCCAAWGESGMATIPEGREAFSGKRRFSYGVQKFGLRILEAIVTLEEARSDAGEKVYLVQAQVDTTGVTSWFFRMHNRFYSWVDRRHLGSLRYVKEIHQRGIFSGEKRYRSVLTFSRGDNLIVVDGTREVAVPPNTQDPLSFFVKYYLGEEIKPAQELRMTIYDGVKLRKVCFNARGESIETQWGGAVDVICLESTVPFSSLGGREGIIRIWFTRDGRRVPVRIGLDLPVGTVQFELESLEEG